MQILLENLKEGFEQCSHYGHCLTCNKMVALKINEQAHLIQDHGCICNVTSLDNILWYYNRWCYNV